MLSPGGVSTVKGSRSDERSRLSERTKAGLAAAEAGGRLGGRPPAMTTAKLEAASGLRRQGKELQVIAETLSVSMSTVTRALARARPGQNGSPWPSMADGGAAAAR